MKLKNRKIEKPKLKESNLKKKLRKLSEKIKK